ncbi:MAG: L-fucose isomerase [Limnochordia bacterium]
MSEFKLNPPCERLHGRLPKVGIRPIIDGRRRGIRESLEDQTMNMAKNVARLISDSIRHPNGLPVECVIPETTIGRVAEAAKCAELFEREGVGLTITVTPCWAYGYETFDMDPLMPKAIWGFNGTERPGAVYLAAAEAGYAQKGMPVFTIYGRDVQDADDETIPPDVAEKILRFVRAGLAVATMKGKSYLSIGSVSMGIAGSMVDHDFFEDYLGMRCESVDMTEVHRRITEGIYDEDEFRRALAWTKEYCKEGEDLNKETVKASREEKDRHWEISVKMAMIVRDLMIGSESLRQMGHLEEAEGHNAIAAGFQGQRQWTDHFPNGDFMEAILNSSFDWNGIRQPYIVATENDSLNGAAMLLGHLLTGRAQVFSDVRTYWSPEAVKRVTGYTLEGAAAGGIIHLLNSGASALDGTGEQCDDAGSPVMKQWWEITEEDAKRCLAATQWRPANREYFRGGGFSSNFKARGGMPVTMSRINLIKGLGPVLQIAEGYTVDLPAEVHAKLNDRTDPTWPTLWFAPRIDGKDGPFKDVYSVMNYWGANHGAISWGHIGADLITLASMLRIPVAMHNVPYDSIFRPKVWGSFGAMDVQGADFRACQNYGPLYGKAKR